MKNDAQNKVTPTTLDTASSRFDAGVELCIPWVRGIFVKDP
jgi:hypothetical protein